MHGGLQALLTRVDHAMTQLGRRYALVGGLAVSVRAEPRFTRDADIVVAVADDSEAEALLRSLRTYGLVPFTITEQEATGRLAMARTRDDRGMVCDVLLANTGVEKQIVAAARPLEILPGLTLPVASLESLLAMKLLSVTASRPQDAMDLAGLLAQAPDLDQVRSLLDAITEADCHRQQDLHAKLAAALGLSAPSP